MQYCLGWQPRYFVLEVGVLAYYKSQEEVGRGSRGSIKMGCCEITGIKPAPDRLLSIFYKICIFFLPVNLLQIFFFSPPN